MNVESFESVFGGAAMRSMLDWGVVWKRQYTVREIFSRSTDLLGRLYTVWYTTPEGSAGDWRNQEDRPLRVREWSNIPQPVERLRRIDQLRQQFVLQSEPVQLLLPAFAVSADEYLLLDGNHRSAAAYASGVDTRLVIFALEGPLEDAALPDLSHFT